jgi:hypothetical protein
MCGTGIILLPTRIVVVTERLSYMVTEFRGFVVRFSIQIWRETALGSAAI